MSNEEIQDSAVRQRSRLVEEYLKAKADYGSLQIDAKHVSTILTKMAKFLESGGDPNLSFTTGGNLEEPFSARTLRLAETLSDTQRRLSELRGSLQRMGVID